MRPEFNQPYIVQIGNRVTEKDIRLWLDKHGWAGKSAKIDQLELHAIQRPGWVQVYRFETQVKRASKYPDSDPANVQATDESNHQWETFFGIVRDDERDKRNPTQVWMFDSTIEQQSKLAEESADLIVLRHGQTATGLFALILIFAGIAFLVGLINWLI